MKKAILLSAFLITASYYASSQTKYVNVVVLNDGDKPVIFITYDTGLVEEVELNWLVSGKQYRSAFKSNQQIINAQLNKLSAMGYKLVTATSTESPYSSTFSEYILAKD